jgi:hypothetical protein
LVPLVESYSPKAFCTLPVIMPRIERPASACAPRHVAFFGGFSAGSMLLADRSYDADWIGELAMKKGTWANIPPKSNRNGPICISPISTAPTTLNESTPWFKSSRNCTCCRWLAERRYFGPAGFESTRAYNLVQRHYVQSRLRTKSRASSTPGLLAFVLLTL